MRANLLATLGLAAICSGCEPQGRNDTGVSPVSNAGPETGCPSQPPSAGTSCANHDMTCRYQSALCLPGQGSNTYSCRTGSWVSDDVCVIIERLCAPNELTSEPCTGASGCQGRWLCDQSGQAYFACQCDFDVDRDAREPDSLDDASYDSGNNEPPADGNPDADDAPIDGGEPE